jgi:hypothetical protein
MTTKAIRSLAHSKNLSDHSAQNLDRSLSRSDFFSAHSPAQNHFRSFKSLARSQMSER